jgi:hypothetical protein
MKTTEVEEVKQLMDFSSPSVEGGFFYVEIDFPKYLLLYLPRLNPNK